MYHTIQFTGEHVFDLEISPRHRLEQTLVHPGTRLHVEIKPYVVETEQGPIEVADLFLDDGTVTRRVPFECFSFVE